MDEDRSFELVEIRLLGTLRVRDANGRPVPARAWRTGKIADLLRVLALRAGEPVSVDLLLDMFWADVDEERGRASLRTAASQVRQALGRDCVERKFDSLTLREAWVDAVAFRTLAQDARRDFVAHRFASAVTRAREADALYLGDVQFAFVESDWAARERDALREAHHEMIANAAEAALELGWLRDGLEFASRSLAYAPYSERAHRLLMRAHAGLGEVDRALRVFADCQRVLAEELGADPSPETRELHLRLLRGEPLSIRARAPFVGRGTERRWLAGAVRSAIDAGKPGMFLIAGEPGIGKTSLVEHVLPDLPAHVTRLSPQPASDVPELLVDRWVGALADGAGDLPVHASQGKVRAREPLVVVIDDLHDAGRAVVPACELLLSRLSGPAVIISTVETGHLVFGDLQNALAKVDFRRQVRRLRLGSLTGDEVAQLTSGLLGEEPMPPLLEELLGDGDGNPSRIVGLLNRWRSSGRLSATSQGLALLPESEPLAGGIGATPALARVLDRTGPAQENVLHLCALLDVPVKPSILSLVFDDLDHAQATSLLDSLHDLGVLRLLRGAYRFRDPVLRDAVLSWFRPSASRQMHRLVAERAPAPASERITHWLHAGETELACAAALEATDEALAQGRYDHAREHLMQVQGLGEVAAAGPDARLEIAERLGDLNAMLGYRDEARQAYADAHAAAQLTGPADLMRVTEKRAGLDNEESASREISTVPLPLGLRMTGAVASRVGISASSFPTPEVESSLRAAVEQADEAGSVQEQLESRLLLASVVCAPQRRFSEARRLADEALALVANPLLRAEATMTAYHAPALLGDAARCLEPLRQVRDLARTGGDGEFLAKAELLSCLVRHETGDPDFADAWLRASALAEASLPDESWRWIGVRAWTERGAYGAAARELEALEGGPDGGKQSAQLAALAAAQLHSATGNRLRAVELLQSCLDAASFGGRGLVLPEAAARLAEINAPESPSSAQRLVDLAEQAAGEAFMGRERCAKLLALAAIRAAGQDSRAAAELAGTAASAAESLGLTFQQAEALVVLAGYLGQNGDRPRMLAVAEQAAKLYQAANAPAASERVLAWLDVQVEQVA